MENINKLIERSLQEKTDRDNLYKEGFKLIAELDKIMEVWKPIKEYENYSISSFGRIKKVATGKILKASLNTTKYQMIDLQNGEKYTKQLVSRLVANAFIPNPQAKPFVDHINGKILDNRFDNLRWVTRQENSVQNRKLQSNNKSGFTGISQKNDLFTAQLHTKRKCIHLGTYNTLEEALKARREGEIKYFGMISSTTNIV